MSFIYQKWLEGAHRECPGAITGLLLTFLPAELTASTKMDHAPISTDSSGGHTSSLAKAWAPLRDPLMGAEKIREPRVCSHQLFGSGLHFPNKPEAPRGILFVFPCDTHGAMLVFWYAGFQARSSSRGGYRQSKAGCSQTLELAMKQTASSLGERTPKFLPATTVNCREEVGHETLTRLLGSSW